MAATGPDGSLLEASPTQTAGTGGLATTEIAANGSTEHAPLARVREAPPSRTAAAGAAQPPLCARAVLITGSTTLALPRVTPTRG